MQWNTILLLNLLTTAAPETQVLVDRAAAIVAQKAKMPNRYMLKYRVQVRLPIAPPPEETEWSSTLHVWRDGNKLRVDHFDAKYTPPRPKHDPRERRITCENCEREGYGITTNVLPGSPLNRHMVEFKKLGTWNFDYYCNGFDWRYFGLSNSGRCFYDRAHVAAELSNRFDEPDVTVKSVNRAGQPCVVASRSEATHNAKWAVTLSEQDGHHPVSFERSFDLEGVPQAKTTEIVWQRIAGGHLFPKRVKHNSIVTVGGTKSPFEEVVTIDHADFESPIDPAVFTVGNFGLNENQVIGYPELDFKDQPRWRNGKVDYSETVGKSLPLSDANVGPPTVAPYPTENNLSLIVGTVAGALAIGTAIAALVIRRNRRVAT